MGWGKAEIPRVSIIRLTTSPMAYLPIGIASHHPIPQHHPHPPLLTLVLQAGTDATPTSVTRTQFVRCLTRQAGECGGGIDEMEDDHRGWAGWTARAHAARVHCPICGGERAAPQHASRCRAGVVCAEGWNG